MAGKRKVPRQVSRVIFPEDGYLQLEEGVGNSTHRPLCGFRRDVEAVFGRIPTRPYLVTYRLSKRGSFRIWKYDEEVEKVGDDVRRSATVCFIPWSDCRLTRTHRVLTKAQARRLAARLNTD